MTADGMPEPLPGGVARTLTYGEIDAERARQRMSVAALCRDAGVARGRYERGVELGQTCDDETNLRLCLVLAVERQRAGG
jgi:hypothetical protein